MKQIKSEWIDVRDGLFPSLRYALTQLKKMNDENDGKFRNSRRFVEKVASDFKTNPEDLYDALINSTYPRCEFNLVDGHGNIVFPPADMRFTEMRVSNFYRQIIAKYNNDDCITPLYIPFSLALSKGTLGSRNHKTGIPPHNIGEVIDATIALIKNPNLKTNDLLKYIKGPDILLGGEIINREQLCKVYESGCGVIEIELTSQNINERFFDCVSDYCHWYNLKLKKYFFRKKQRVLIKYEATLFNGETIKRMSLKEILQSHIDYCKSIETDISDNALCHKLEELKKLSVDRRTIA